MTSDLNISLEDHLRDTLASLHGLPPPELSTQLEVYLNQPKPALIPYTVLHSLSQWSRSSPGSSALCSSTPPRDPNDFSMISLLAGTTTSPERKFGVYVPPRDPEEIEAERKKERRAITTLMNAILSVGGSGFAAWWASQHAGWKKEWVRSKLCLLPIFYSFLLAGSLWAVCRRRRCYCGSSAISHLATATFYSNEETTFGIRKTQKERRRQ